MYTVEIYRADKRTKAGERLIYKEDMIPRDRETVERMARNSCKKNERYEIHETYVTRKNAMNGEEYQERYDTPYYCSPSSETYWSM
jgi:hypothetical protein